MGTKNVFCELTKVLVGNDWTAWRYRDVKDTVVGLEISYVLYSLLLRQNIQL